MASEQEKIVLANFNLDRFREWREKEVWDHAHEYGVSFLGLGHYGTETIGPRALAPVVQKQLGIPAVFIETENPF